MLRRKSMAFYVETLLLVLFLLGILVVLVPMFTSARLESRRASRLTTGVQLAQNVTECLAASASADELALLLQQQDAAFAWQADGTGALLLAGQGAQKSESYRVTLALEQTAAATGQMAGLTVKVYTGEAELVYTAQASRYWPGGHGGGGHGA